MIHTYIHTYVCIIRIYVCIIRIYVCMIHTYTYVRTYVCMNIYVRTHNTYCTYIHANECMYIYIRMYVLCVYTYMRMNVCIYTYVCKKICMFVCRQLHTYIYTHTHMHYVLISPPPSNHMGKDKNIFFSSERGPPWSYKCIFYFFPHHFTSKNGR